MRSCRKTLFVHAPDHRLLGELPGVFTDTADGLHHLHPQGCIKAGIGIGINRQNGTASPLQRAASPRVPPRSSCPTPPFPANRDQVTHCTAPPDGSGYLRSSKADHRVRPSRTEDTVSVGAAEFLPVGDHGEKRTPPERLPGETAHRPRQSLCWPPSADILQADIASQAQDAPGAVHRPLAGLDDDDHPIDAAGRGSSQMLDAGLHVQDQGIVLCTNADP